MSKSKGVVIIAGGSNYYGMCAANLAASIRYKDKNIPITIFTDGSALKDVGYPMLPSGLKADIVVMDEKFYTDPKTGKHNFYMAKSRLFDLTPYDYTLYLDADSMWLKKASIEEFFEQQGESVFNMANEGYVDIDSGQSHLSGFYTHWKDVSSLREIYGRQIAGKRLYQLRSELIYFKKCAETRKLFAAVRKVYDNPKTDSATIAGVLPDEYSFNLACAITGVYPATDKWYPMYWEYKNTVMFQLRLGLRPLSDVQVVADFYAYSIGGNRLSEKQTMFYREKMKGFYSQQRFGEPFIIPNKRDVLPARKNM